MLITIQVNTEITSAAGSLLGEEPGLVWMHIIVV